jgi:hypothetical protein
VKKMTTNCEILAIFFTPGGHTAAGQEQSGAPRG